jgi:hypothetical protein
VRREASKWELPTLSLSLRGEAASLVNLDDRAGPLAVKVALGVRHLCGSGI